MKKIYAIYNIANDRETGYVSEVYNEAWRKDDKGEPFLSEESDEMWLHNYLKKAWFEPHLEYTIIPIYKKIIEE